MCVCVVFVGGVFEVFCSVRCGWVRTFWLGFGGLAFVSCHQLPGDTGHVGVPAVVGHGSCVGVCVMVVWFGCLYILVF